MPTTASSSSLATRSSTRPTKAASAEAAIDGEINFPGGLALEEAREALPLLTTYKRCNTGDAKITIAGDLPCKNVIHAVGPNFEFGDVDHSQNLGLLESAYKNSLERAREPNLKTIGFCLLLAGIFRG